MARKKQKQISKYDFVFLLKLILYLVLGFLWFWFRDSSGVVKLVLPVGPMLGVLFARHEHFQIDRRLEYTALLLSSFIGFMFETGVYL